MSSPPPLHIPSPSSSGSRSTLHGEKNFPTVRDDPATQSWALARLPRVLSAGPNILVSRISLLFIEKIVRGAYLIIDKGLGRKSIGYYG